MFAAQDIQTAFFKQFKANSCITQK